MRDATSAQLADLARLHRDDRVRVRVWDSGGPQDLTDWVLSWSIARDEDSPIDAARVTFRRESASGSLVPLMEGANVVEAGRRLTIDVAVVDVAVEPDAGDWVPLFDGETDDVSWGGRPSQLTVPARDPAAVLHRTWIEEEEEYGDDDTPVPIEEVVEAILEDNFGEDEVPLRVIGDPDFGIRAYTLGETDVLSALRALVDLIGWNLRYLWDDAEEEFVLTLYEPDRAKATPDHTFGPRDYFDLPELVIDPAPLRNVVRVIWSETSKGIAEDAAAIARWGRRVITLNEAANPQIDTEPKAEALAAAVLSDLSQPGVLVAAELPLFWPAELEDLYRFEPNGVHHAQALDLAVYGIEHRGSATESRTVLRMRERPSGGVYRWIRREKVLQEDREIREAAGPPQPFGTLVGWASATGDVSATASGNSAVVSWRIASSTSGPPSDEDIASAPLLLGRNQTTADVGTLETLAPGETAYLAARPYSGLGTGAGERIDVSRDFGVVGDGIAAGSVAAAKMTRQAQTVLVDGDFETSGEGTIEWFGGSVRFADGTSGSFDAGSLTIPNDINAGTARYIYYDGTTTLKVVLQGASAAALGDDKVILAVARRGDSANGPFLLTLGGAQAKISALQIETLFLSAISSHIGEVVAGVLRNAADDFRIKLDATGSEPSLQHPNFTLLANGDATFAGILSAASGTFSGDLSAAGGTFSGDLSAAGGSFRGDLEIDVTEGNEVRIIDGTETRGRVYSANDFGDVSLRLESGFGARISLGFHPFFGTGQLLLTGGLTRMDAAELELGTSSTEIGFFGGAKTGRPTITGSRGGNAALASLLTALANMGLITDSTS